MKLLKIKDNTINKKSDFYVVENITSRVADKTLDQLEREGIFIFPNTLDKAEDITREQMILQSKNDTYCSGNVMGFIGCKDERLVIESRFGEQDKDDKQDNDYFFMYLLEKVLGFPNVVDLETNADNDNSIFNMLLFLFPRYLKTAMRKGLFKTYIRRKYNDSNVKGIIDVARHIDEDTPFIGNIAYVRREYSYDNYLTQLIRHTIEFIKKESFGRKLLSEASDEVKIIMSATQKYEQLDRQKILSKNIQIPTRHAYYREYRALQRLCIMILRHKKIGMGFNSNQIFGVLFDGAWLWEEYVNTIISDAFYHPMNKSCKGAQMLFGGNVGKIYPDFISRVGGYRIIADAKYKPIENIGSRDYLQVLAYMLRFDSKLGYYLYPESKGKGSRRLKLNQGTTYENNVMPRDDISLVKRELAIPKGTKSYDEFKDAIRQSENEFKNSIS